MYSQKRFGKLVIGGWLALYSFFSCAEPNLPTLGATAPESFDNQSGARSVEINARSDSKKRPSDELSIQAAIETALQDNPGLAEISARAKAKDEIPSQVGTLPDPVIHFNAMNLPVDTFNRTQEPMTQLQVGVSQTFPFPGKLGLRESAAEYEAAAAGNDVEEMRLLLIRDVKQNWWHLFYLDRALQTVRRNQQLMRQFVEVAQTKYRVGEGLQQDVLLAQVELSKLLDLEVQLKSLRRTGEARLNALLNRPTQGKLRLPAEVETKLRALAPEESWQSQAKGNRPLLAAERKRIQAARKRLDLAKKDYFPDFKLGAAYGFRGGTDPLQGRSRADLATFMLSVEVPLYAGSKQAKAVDQRSSEVLEQIYSLQDRRQQVRREISTALANYRESREQFLLFKTGIIPQTRQTVASMLAGYQVNKVDFLNLVNAQITLYNYETKYWKALAEAHQALAALSAATGEEAINEKAR